MTTIEELDRALMGQYTIDSMIGCRPVPGLKLGDISSFPHYQEQAVKWCHNSKPLFLTKELKGMPGVSSIQLAFMESIKEKIADYKDNPQIRKDPTMKWFYECGDTELVITQILMLAHCAIYRDVKNVRNATREEEMASLEPESVSIMIAIYVYFTIIVNPHYSSEDYDTLFQHCWYEYYEKWMARNFMISMAGDNWRSGLENALI